MYVDMSETIFSLVYLQTHHRQSYGFHKLESELERQTHTCTDTHRKKQTNALRAAFAGGACLKN